MRYTGDKIKRVIWLILLITALPVLNAQDRVSLEEYKAKSVFLYKLCKFTRWPVPLDSSKPFVISILGKLPPGTSITIPSLTIGNQKVLVKTIRRLDEIDGSNVLYITSSEAHRIGVIMDYVAGKTILTVGDIKDFVEQGVMLNIFINNQGSLAFAINDDSIKKAKFEVPGQLYIAGHVFRNGKYESKKYAY